MKTFTTAATLAAMAVACYAQDPYGNRMNDDYAPAPPWVTMKHPYAEPAPLPFENRMNIRYAEVAPGEVSGGPDPYGNRMNWESPKSWPVTPPKRTEPPPPPPVYPAPTP